MLNGVVLVSYIRRLSGKGLSSPNGGNEGGREAHAAGRAHRLHCGFRFDMISIRLQEQPRGGNSVRDVWPGRVGPPDETCHDDHGRVADDRRRLLVPLADSPALPDIIIGYWSRQEQFPAQPQYSLLPGITWQLRKERKLWILFLSVWLPK